MENRPTVLHVITGLGDGGAEGVLYRLICNDKANHHVVVSLTRGGKYQALLEENGIQVICLKLERGKVSLNILYKLYLAIYRIRPKVVQTWMYHADLIGGIIAKLNFVDKVVWNLRHSHLHLSNTKRSTIIIARLCALLSRYIPDLVVCCADEAMLAHENLGYSKSKMEIIYNGYDLDRFKPNNNVPSISNLYNYVSEVPIMGMVGRYTPEKDHGNLLRALSIVSAKGVDFRFFLAGTDIDTHNSELVSLIDQYDLNERIILLGPVSDVPLLMNQIDLHILSSCSEGFPNVLPEAMACGTPCITTNAGAAANIVGDVGWVVPINDSASLAGVIYDALSEFKNSKHLWSIRREAAVQRIKDNFSIETMVDNYNKVWFN